jgi:DNA-directed RNA polymerase subunit RPC12/RpoP
MEQQECARCGKSEPIATHQFVKVEDKIQYLCRQCWEEFRYWFNRPDKRGDDKKKRTE